MNAPSGPSSGLSFEGKSSNQIAGATWLALCLALGIALSRGLDWMSKWSWIALAAVMLASAFSLKVRSPRACFIFVMVTTIALGAAWYTVRHTHAGPNELASWVDEESRLVHLRGIALGPPSRRDRTDGSMGRFDYRPPSTYFPMRVEALIGDDGREIEVQGHVYVGVTETIAPFRAGDLVKAKGYLRTPTLPKNPGEYDIRRLARSLGQAGTLNVPSRDLIEITAAKRLGVHLLFLKMRQSIQRRAGGWLLSGLPGDGNSQRDALLSALLLGRRELQFEGISESFRRVGLAHLLAISGLHLGVLAGFVLLVLRLFGTSPRWQGWVVIFVVASYLFLVEVRLPVLRAGIMMIMSCVALISGRRLRVSGLVAFSAIILLLWRPDQLFTAGFQLSFGVVLGIVHLARPLRERWFGRPNQVVASSMQMIGQWLRTTFAVTVTAWLIALPITAYHFGVITPMAVPFSILALPMVALLLAIGYSKMLLTLFLPSGALVLGVPLSIGTDSLLSMIEAIDSLPGSIWHIPFPSAGWTFLSLAWACLYARDRNRIRRKYLRVVPFVLLLLLLWPSFPWRQHETLRIDMLAVGNGSCFVIRSGGRCALFDAGSSTDLDAGTKVIVPALRRLGVRTIDFIAISHANLDHYSAVLEIVDAFKVDTVLVTPHMHRSAEGNREGSVSYLFDQLTARFVRIDQVVAGYSRRLGTCEWRWIHPDRDDRFDASNNESMVILIQGADRTALLCGDIQSEAIQLLMERAVSGRFELGADVLELPHHGSHNVAAQGFVRIVDPEIVMQSTGARRWMADRWADDLKDRVRLVTVRDGACSVQFNAEGDLFHQRFLSTDQGNE